MTLGQNQLSTLGFDHEVDVLLAVEEDLLGSLLVLEPQLVEAPASLRAVRLQGALGLVGREVVRRRLVAVVDASGDDRKVGISLEELDDHFLADPRQEHGAPTLAGPVLGDSHPARAVLVALALAIPMKLDFHATVLIDPELFVFLADDDRGLDAMDDGSRRQARGAERDGQRDRRERVLVATLGAVGLRHIARLAARVRYRRHDVALIERAVRMLGQIEPVS